MRRMRGMFCSWLRWVDHQAAPSSRPCLDPVVITVQGKVMARTPEWSYDEAWPCHPDNVAKARAFVCRHLLDGGLPVVVDDARLVVSELAANAVVHARTPFGVTISRFDGVVEIAVRDGVSFPPSVSAAEEEHESGRGLRLVELCSESWGVTAPSAGGKSVWARFEVAGL